MDKTIYIKTLSVDTLSSDSYVQLVNDITDIKNNIGVIDEKLTEIIDN